MNLIDKLKFRYSKLELDYVLPDPILDNRFISEITVNEMLNDDVLSLPLYKENALTSDFCNKIIDFFESSEQHHRTYQGIINKKFRDSLYVKLSANYKDIVFKTIKDCLIKDFHKEVVTDIESEILIYKYPTGIGFEAHHDMVTLDEYTRSLEKKTPIIPGDYTFIFFLNTLDEDQGGELIFPEFDNILFRAVQGSLVAFRVDYVHKVNPIIFGNRYSMPVRIFINQNIEND